MRSISVILSGLGEEKSLILKKIGFTNFSQLYFAYLLIKDEKSKKKPPSFNKRLFDKHGVGVDISRVSDTFKKLILEWVEDYMTVEDHYVDIRWQMKILELCHTLPSYEAVSRWFCVNGKEYTKTLKDLLEKRDTNKYHGNEHIIEDLIMAEVKRHKKFPYPRQLRNRQHVQKYFKLVMEFANCEFFNTDFE